MKQRIIGSFAVSVVGLGCNNFGGRMNDAETEMVVNAAIDAGINFFDTADIYGGTKSEVALGRALGKRRNYIVLATKFGAPIDDQHKGADPTYVRQAVEDSLRRLGTDRIDLYQLHLPDAGTPIADTLDVLNELVIAGKVREIGCSNFSTQQLAEANRISNDSHLARFVSVQNEYSLLKRDPETNGVLDECAQTGTAFLPYFPLASGLLTGKYRYGQPAPQSTRLSMPAFADRLTEDKLATVEQLIAFAEARGHTILELAFSWLLRQPAVASVIAGATKPEQITANVNAASWSITEADRAEVEGIISMSSEHRRVSADSSRPNNNS
jgi:aryl-alcohol dehydrogenase-like predicted oxidoreductase